MNIHGQHRDVLVEDSTVVDSGDDSFAMWSIGTAQVREKKLVPRGSGSASPTAYHVWNGMARAASEILNQVHEV